MKQERMRRSTLLLKRHTLTPFAVPAGLLATVRCVLLMHAHAAALQTTHGITVGPRVTRELWPVVEQVPAARLLCAAGAASIAARSAFVSSLSSLEPANKYLAALLLSKLSLCHCRCYSGECVGSAMMCGSRSQQRSTNSRARCFRSRLLCLHRSRRCLTFLILMKCLCCQQRLTRMCRVWNQQMARPAGASSWSASPQRTICWTKSTMWCPPWRRCRHPASPSPCGKGSESFLGPTRAPWLQPSQSIRAQPGDCQTRSVRDRRHLLSCGKTWSAADLRNLW